MHVVGGSQVEPARAIENVPIEYLHPGPDQVVIRRITSTESRGGILIPEKAQVAVVVAVKVGKNVEHVQPGDVVIMSAKTLIDKVLEVERPGSVGLIPGDRIVGVIRDYAWQDQDKKPAIAEVVEAP